MGAHTLGSAKIENSGYIGAWILAEAGDFNNRFYTYMLNNSVSWAPQNVARPGEDPKFQIEAFEGSVKRAMMLNTDFELFYHLDLDSNAMPTCDMNVDSLTCQQRAETYATAVTYANVTLSHMMVPNSLLPFCFRQLGPGPVGGGLQRRFREADLERILIYLSASLCNLPLG